MQSLIPTIRSTNLHRTSHKNCWDRHQVFSVGVQSRLKEKWKDWVPSVSTFLRRVNQFQYTQGEGISCFGNFSWQCNSYGPCLGKSADLSGFAEEISARFPPVTPRRAVNWRKPWVPPAPSPSPSREDIGVRPSSGVRPSFEARPDCSGNFQSIFECLQGWTLHSLHRKPAGEAWSWTAEGLTQFWLCWWPSGGLLLSK